MAYPHELKSTLACNSKLMIRPASQPCLFIYPLCCGAFLNLSLAPTAKIKFMIPVFLT